MSALPSLEERVSIVEDTVARLVMSLPLPDAAVRRLHGDVILLNRETATVRQSVIELSVEAQEIQETLGKHTKTLDIHGSLLKAYAAPHRAVQHHAALRCAAPCRAALRHAAPCRAVPRCAARRYPRRTA